MFKGLLQPEVAGEGDGGREGPGRVREGGDAVVQNIIGAGDTGVADASEAEADKPVAVQGGWVRGLHQ